MGEEVKKISFGFSKSVKKPALKGTVSQEAKKVDYIECLDEKSIKVVGVEEKKENEPLIIPMRGSKTWHDRIINKIDADIFEPKPSTQNGDKAIVEVKKEPAEEPMETEGTLFTKPPESVTVKEPEEKYNEPPKTLEEQAAQEILRDLNSVETNGDKPNLFTLPINESSSLVGEKEATLEDYENIPIDLYGIAMLRGMGWKPGKGIGKNEKLVEASVPELRPKGMGLGADKVTMQKANGKPRTKEEEDLKLVTGAYIKIIAGKQKDSYGQIEGLDDDAGRFIVKMALGGNVVSLNEAVVQAVTKEDYLKNSKVLNSAKYQEYKARAAAGDSPDSEQEERKTEKKESNSSSRKKIKKHRRRSSSYDNSPDQNSRKRKSSESSEAEKKSKKSKKSKKHKSRDSSAERSSRKNRKKDKERERRKDRRCSESPERRKQKKHKRSRSRSPRR
ncbi:G-patch domain and KOW motifs-containing protein [Athalia rosae]|uniref:G-patch domain and KOW motifs-containing protein n=1 Tax=Athalia rosae TaxID=37344 RepID=UPI0020346047|nr:G-patch domain and KOW motifs-containing protein [Athalia rosae]